MLIKFMMLDTRVQTSLRPEFMPILGTKCKWLTSQSRGRVPRAYLWKLGEGSTERCGSSQEL